ncbi:MAG: non-heme iron oxygenase ferredoxin subunit [Gammaproteobacteria bacterium]|jgi:3-phenylpropionate/trans-cinnamate dioxygenase ferredoxin component
MGEWVDVAPTNDFPPGTSRRVEIDDVTVAVFNLDGEFYAIEDVCTHDYSPLEGGNVEGGEIICPRHGARFDIKTGEALSAPAYEPLPTFPVRVENGLVQVRDDRWD